MSGALFCDNTTTQTDSSSSAFSGDTADPARTMPRAMAITLVFVVLTYVVPLAVATGAAPRARYCDGCMVWRKKRPLATSL
jgi:amino acid transporter